jgi:hypothetical protein
MQKETQRLVTTHVCHEDEFIRKLNFVSNLTKSTTSQNSMMECQPALAPIRSGKHNYTRDTSDLD